jgi:hypothetical protein
MIQTPTLFIAMLALSGFSATISDDPEAVVRNFLRAAKSHDTARFNAMVFPQGAGSILIRSEPVPKEKLREIESEASSVKLRQVQPFRRLGVSGSRVPGGEYPEGTTTRYLTLESDSTVVSLVKKEGRWLVDVRWWLKLREMALQSEKSRLDEKELLIKKFLLNLLRLDRRAVINGLVPGAKADIAFEGAPRVPEPSDVLPSLAIEMPLVEADPDEVYPLLSGKLVKRSANGDETVMVGLFGPFEMVFLLRKVEREWRIVPEPYYRILNR